MYKAVRVVNTFRRTERRTVCRRNGNGCAACPGISDRDYVDGFRYAEKKLLLLDGVSGAKANFKRNIIFVETELPDAALAACITDAGFTVKEIRERKGIFG